MLDSVIREVWGSDASCVLDVSCGIGTQALGLARLGYRVTASDLSPEEVGRAKREAAARGLSIAFSVADMRQAFTHHAQEFDIVISCDNMDLMAKAGFTDLRRLDGRFFQPVITGTKSG